MLAKLGYETVMCPDCEEIVHVHEEQFYEEGFICPCCGYREDAEEDYDYDGDDT